MIFVLEHPPDAAPRAWFAYGPEDLARKLEGCDAGELLARGRCRVFGDESAALPYSAQRKSAAVFGFCFFNDT